MSGRGDKNRHGSAGRGAGNQSNQPFIPDGRKEPASDQRKQDRNNKTFNLSVDDVPYVVETKAFTYNEEERYYVRVNGGPEHVFTWDPEVHQFRAIDDDATMMPASLEVSI